VEPGLAAEVVERAVSAGLTVGWHAAVGRQEVLGGFESGKLLSAFDDLGSPEALATIERLAARAAELLEAIESIAGPRSRLVVVGGWARNDAVRKVKDRALGAFEQPELREPGAYGAALLAGKAAGLYAAAPS
jgi:hypothetical protein